MSVIATAPCRIDLAGGTLDLEFLYAFLGGAVTVNVAVEVRAQAFARRLRPGRVRLVARDLEAEATGRSIDSLSVPAALGLHGRALAHYGPKTGVEVVTEAAAPKGSGLGGSSALLMALSAALLRLQGLRASKRPMVDTGARLEASVLGVPTGKQDYLAALYGGLAAHHFSYDGWRVERLDVSTTFLRALEGGLVLAFTGESRLSGAPNWEKFKAYVENTGSARRRFKRLKAIAQDMREALLAEDLEHVGRLLSQEWAERRRLAPGVSFPALDAALSRAKRAGALGGKLCGAGGGGCLVMLAADGRRGAVEQVLRGAGFRLMPFRVAQRGLVVKQEADV
jgi:D-glycero-alpha-D-manno-heptose-7-phosphate kinase